MSLRVKLDIRKVSRDVHTNMYMLAYIECVHYIFASFLTLRKIDSFIPLRDRASSSERLNAAFRLIRSIVSGYLFFFFFFSFLFFDTRARVDVNDTYRTLT